MLMGLVIGVCVVWCMCLKSVLFECWLFVVLLVKVGDMGMRIF